MHRHAVRGSHGANPFDGRQGIDGAATAIMGVLETDQRGLNPVRISWADGRFHLLRLDDAPGPIDPVELDAGEGPGCPLLIADDVRLAFDDDFLARLRVTADRQLIGHRSGRDKQGRLFAEEPGHHLLEAIDGGVFAVDVVADFRARHRFAHGVGGLRHGIAAQVDDLHTWFHTITRWTEKVQRRAASFCLRRPRRPVRMPRHDRPSHDDSVAHRRGPRRSPAARLGLSVFFLPAVRLLHPSSRAR